MSPRPAKAGPPRGRSGPLRATVRSWWPGRSRAAADDGSPCECGHPREAHEHYRRGSDCALCSCPRYRRA